MRCLRQLSFRISALSVNEHRLIIMEPLGAVASAFTLVEALGQTSNAVRKLSRRIKNAPQELESLETSLDLLRLCIQHMEPLSCDLGPEVSAHIGAALRQAGNILTSLDQACERQHLQSKTLSRLNWALLDGSKMEGQLAQLRNVQGTLQNFLQIIGLYAAALRQPTGLDISDLLTQFKISRQRQTRADMELFTVRNLVVDLSRDFKNSQPLPESPPDYDCKEVVRKTDEAHRITAEKVVASDWLKRCGILYSLLGIRPEATTACSNYSLGFHVRLPFSARSVVGQISWTKHPLSNSISLASPSHFSLSRFVAGDSDGFVACLSGDLASLKRHLASGAATLEDVTAKNWTLMTVSSDGSRG
jgi:hypothetical protein